MDESRNSGTVVEVGNQCIDPSDLNAIQVSYSNNLMNASLETTKGLDGGGSLTETSSCIPHRLQASNLYLKSSTDLE